MYAQEWDCWVIWFIYFLPCQVFVAAQGLFLIVVRGDYSLAAVGGLLTEAASPVAEHRLRNVGFSSCGMWA